LTDKPKPPAKPDDPEQSKRFIDMAHEVEVDERPEAFDRAFESVAHPNNSPKSSIKKT
jgi:hypothetical protein